MAELHSQHKDDVLVVQFTTQKILADTTIAQVERELLELVDNAQGKMLLNFDGVIFMSSSMIGKIVKLSKKCGASNTVVKLCSIGPSIKEVFEITRINRLLSIYETEEEALASFQKKGWFG